MNVRRWYTTTPDPANPDRVFLLLGAICLTPPQGTGSHSSNTYHRMDMNNRSKSNCPQFPELLPSYSGTPFLRAIKLCETKNTTPVVTKVEPLAQPHGITLPAGIAGERAGIVTKKSLDERNMPWC
jgi:hypothetical protein